MISKELKLYGLLLAGIVGDDPTDRAVAMAASSLGGEGLRGVSNERILLALINEVVSLRAELDELRHEVDRR